MPPPSPIAEQVSRGLSEGLASEHLLTLAEFNDVVRPVLSQPAHWREGVAGINRFLQETRSHWNWRFVISPAALAYLRGLQGQGVDVGSVRALQARQPEAGRYYDALKERFSDGELSLAEFVPLSRDLTGADFYRGGLAGLVLALETMRKEGVEVEGEIAQQLGAKYSDYIAAGILTGIRTYQGESQAARAARATIEQEFGIAVVEEQGRRFTLEMLTAAIDLFRPLPPEHRQLVKTLLRTPTCPSGKCLIAGTNIQTGTIGIYDSFFDEALIGEAHPDEVNLPLANRFRRTLAHEVGHLVTHRRVAAEQERLIATCQRENHRTLTERLTHRCALLRETLLARWAAINGWTIPGPERGLVSQYELLLHMQGDEGLGILLRGVAEEDRDYVILRWFARHNAWQVSDATFATHAAGSLTRGPEHALVETYALYVTDRAGFYARASQNPILMQQYRFVEREFFTPH